MRLRLTGSRPPNTRFDLQGHRGARGLAPENTLAGLATTQTLGIATVEVDVAMTADGVPVLSHDPVLNPDLTRDADGSWLTARGPPIAALTVADLARYDVGRARPGSATARHFPDQVAADGARIPTLAEALLAFPSLRFNLELKTFPDAPDLTVSPEAMVDTVLGVVERLGALPRIAVQSFDWRAPRHVRRHWPAVATGWLTEPATLRAAELWCGSAPPGPGPEAVPALVAAASAGGNAFWAAAADALHEAEIAAAHALGLLVIAWTVNHRSGMRELIEAGVDGLISDRPDLGLEAMGENGA